MALRSQDRLAQDKGQAHHQLHCGCGVYACIYVYVYVWGGCVYTYVGVEVRGHPSSVAVYLVCRFCL